MENIVKGGIHSRCVVLHGHPGKGQEERHQIPITEDRGREEKAGESLTFYKIQIFCYS